MLKKITILIISERQAELSDFIEVIQKEKDADLLLSATVEDAIQLADDRAPALIVVDEKVAHPSGLDLVRRFIEMNAFAHTAVLTSLSEDDFHRRSEGLGILARLPIQPQKKDAFRLLDLFEQLTSTMGPK